VSSPKSVVELSGAPCRGTHGSQWRGARDARGGRARHVVGLEIDPDAGRRRGIPNFSGILVSSVRRIDLVEEARHRELMHGFV
jgi:hypothetical protein